MTLTIYHGNWYYTINEGGRATYHDTALKARQSAKRRGYRFDRVEKRDGRVVEVWTK